MAESMDIRERERRRVARIMQEKAENKRELAQALHVWKGRMLSNDSCCVLPGDYMAVGNGCMCSSRGAILTMSEKDLQALIEGGALSKVFDMDDLNAPDMSTHLDHVMSKIVQQRHWADATAYYTFAGELEGAIAVYDVPEPDGGSKEQSESTTLTVERNGSGFVFHTGSWSGGAPVRQCSYEEFNPGGAKMIEELTKSDKKEQGRSRSALFEKMQREYMAGGENEIVKPDEALRRMPGYENMSPTERMLRLNDLQNERNEALKRGQQQEQAPSESDQWGPKLPGERRRF